MAPLNKFQKEAILRRVDFANKEIKEIFLFSDFDEREYLKNIEKRKVIERTIENIVNCIIDISKILLSGENIEIPRTYSEAVRKLQEVNFISKKDSEILSNFVRLRNLLSHEYLDILWKEIKNFIDNIEIIRNFIEKVKKKVK